jgi:hypothetical protein
MQPLRPRGLDAPGAALDQLRLAEGANGSPSARAFPRKVGDHQWRK